MGDLDHLEAYRAFVRDIKLYEELFRFQPNVIAHDLHPDYASTRYARERAQELGVELIAVQHHHAHMASCMVENGLNEKVIGVSLDGTGYGTDGAIWGGEFLVGDYAGFVRAGHLRYVGLPGGDAAVKEIWRMGLVQILDAGEGVTCDRFLARVKATERQVVERMIERGFNTPRTSSMGRLFDAVAALAGVKEKVSFEGQAAMELEWASEKFETRNSGGGKLETQAYAFEIEEGGGATRILDTRLLIRGVVEDVEKGMEVGAIGLRFHRTAVEMIVEMCRRIRRDMGVVKVVLSGGVFMNGILLKGAIQRLSGEGFDVYRHRVVPANDGGLCLGQIAVAAWKMNPYSPGFSRDGICSSEVNPG